MSSPYPPPPPPNPYQSFQAPKKGLSKPALIAIIVAAVVVFCCGGLGVLGLIVGSEEPDGDATDTAASSASTPKAKPSETSGPSAPAEPPSSAAPALDCTEADPGRLRGLADGARKGVKIVAGFVGEVETDTVAEYAAYAVRVSKGGETADVVLAAPVTEGESLTLATEGALPYFNWGDVATDGSPVDEIRDTVEASDGAAEALACLSE
ncbi:MAG: hypothetical protein JWN84_2762 [Nocardioides sp.]|nr:hypothetical protein [Nocardioides sp.]